MNEPPGLPAALGIEAVEWLGQGSDTLTVRVRGRWRRRRATPSGQPLLVIEVNGTRHRYPAMPEPPSLTGAAPGTWQVSFAVPFEVVAQGGARAWLQVGAVVVPLPVPVETETSPPGEESGRAAPDEETLAQRRTRAAELAAEAAARRVAEAQAALEALEARIEELEDELHRANALVAERNRAVRAAEQRAHAERGLRQELEERLARVEELAEYDEDDERDLRIAELERELEWLRRRVDEAEHVARTSEAARRRAELRVSELSQKSSPVLKTAGMVREFGTARAAFPAHQRQKHVGPALADDLQRVRQERSARDARATATTALRNELEARSLADAELRAQLAALQAERDRAPEPEPELRATLVELRSELIHLSAALEAESAARERADQRVIRAYDAIQEVRDELSRVREGQPPAPSSGLGSAVEAERLNAALARLRESTPQPDTDAPAPSALWLRQALRTASRRDPDGAARMLAVMLPGTPEEARVARRLLAAGPLRSRLRRGAARLRGRGAVAARLGELLRAPARFADLRLEPRATMLLASAMIDPSWSSSERFTIAFDTGPYLHIRGSDAALVTDTTLGPVTTTIVCAPEQLSAVLAGARPPGTVITGDHRPLDLLHEWLERAQSG